MPENLYRGSSPPAEDRKIAGVRVAAKPLLNLERQPVHASPQVGHADREPDAQSRGNRDHARRSSTSRIRAKAAASKSGPTTILCPLASTISMRPMAPAV